MEQQTDVFLSLSISLPLSLKSMHKNTYTPKYNGLLVPLHSCDLYITLNYP